MEHRCGCISIIVGWCLSVWLAIAAWAQEPDKAKIDAGETVYGTYCAPCHGDQLVSTGQFPNLRRLTPADRAKFENTVRHRRNRMPPSPRVVPYDQINP